MKKKKITGGAAKKPYTKPKLTVHGDLRKITAAKGSNRRETGRPRTWNTGPF